MTESRVIDKDNEAGIEFRWDALWSNIVRRQESTTDVRLLEIADSCLFLASSFDRPPWSYSLIQLAGAPRRHESIASSDAIGRSADEIVPQVFDEIVIHFRKPPPEDPVKLVYSLFRRGFIREKTFVSMIFREDAVLGTTFPQARKWLLGVKAAEPSSRDLLHAFLEMLQFRNITIREEEGLANPMSGGKVKFLVAEGRNSDFAEFIHERYVPRTWTELSDYEHVPRYLLASHWALGKRILDFACGVGFGSLLMAKDATSVLAVDISRDALEWGRRFYSRPNLRFDYNDDLATSLPPKSFDLVVCFEVIEHLSTDQQNALLRNFSRLLTDQGTVLVSTPNPKATELYDSNPFHLTELRRDELETLLRAHFRFVEISEQTALPAVVFSGKGDDNQIMSSFFDAPASAEESCVLNWVAACSNEVGVVALARVFVDSGSDLIRQRIQSLRKIDELRLRGLELAAQLGQQQEELTNHQAQAESFLVEKKLLTDELAKLAAQLGQQQEELRNHQAQAESFLVEKKLLTNEPAELAAQLGQQQKELRNHQAQAESFLVEKKLLTNELATYQAQNGTLTNEQNRLAAIISRRPLVSVVVPSYNHARYLAQRLGSIFDQSFQDFEVIFLDDASKDESVALAKEIAAGKPVRFVVNERNSGSPFHQWNKGAAFARGELLWIAESDDFADPRFLEQVVPLMESNEEISIAYCQSWLVDSEGNTIESLLSHTADIDADRWRRRFINSGRDELKRFLCLRNTIPNTSACLVRRAALAEIGFAPTHLRQCGDWLTWVKILKKGDIAFIPEHLNFYRVHPGTIRKQMERAALEMIEVYQVQSYIREHIGLDDTTLEWARTVSFNRWLWLGTNTWSGPLDLVRHVGVLRTALRFDPTIPYRLGKALISSSDLRLRSQHRQKF